MHHGFHPYQIKEKIFVYIVNETQRIFMLLPGISEDEKKVFLKKMKKK